MVVFSFFDSGIEIVFFYIRFGEYRCCMYFDGFLYNFLNVFCFLMFFSVVSFICEYFNVVVRSFACNFCTRFACRFACFRVLKFVCFGGVVFIIVDFIDVDVFLFLLFLFFLLLLCVVSVYVSNGYVGVNSRSFRFVSFEFASVYMLLM